MCTAVTIRSARGETCFGRTMDFSYPLDPELYFIPRKYEWSNLLNTHIIHNKYTVMGIGQNLSPVILADGVNETGFAAAALYFPGYAQYDPVSLQNASPYALEHTVPDGTLRESGARMNPPVAALELVNFLLGQCSCTQHAVSLLHTIRIIGVKDAVTDSVAPLHWIIADKTGSCKVIEKTNAGLEITDNPIGVLSNSPDFSWHMTNLRNYMNVKPTQHQEVIWGKTPLTPFGQGTGTFGLPGDYTPPSRFVRTAYLKTHTDLPADPDEMVTAGFHILESVSIPKGVVITSHGTFDYTQYTALINLNAQEYYFKTYDNSEITAVKMPCADDSTTSQIASLGKLNCKTTYAQL